MTALTETDMGTATVGVSIRGLVKRYGDTVALAGLSLEVDAGKIHGIAGPNGAGKSTLIKILAGEERPDEGSISIYGEPWTQDMGAHRVAVVHQEAELFPNLTVAENMLAGREGTSYRRPYIGRVERTVVAEMGLSRYLDSVLGSLPLGLQQRTEIARALIRKADVFLFDEPNSALTESESEELFAQMRTLADRGRTVLFVTHRVAELEAMADAVTIIIDGLCRSHIPRSEITQERIARELVVGSDQHQRVVETERIALDGDAVRVQNWTHAKGKFRDVDLEIARGEIVAVAGVEGSGGRELVRSIVGLEKAVGASNLNGRRGVEFVAADRSDSLFANLTVGENLYIRQDRRIRNSLGLMRFKAASQLAESARSDFAVKAASLQSPVRSLSGGNQQKVAIASALAANPELLVLEEPTRGVDIGSKVEIYRLIRTFADNGGSVLLFCTENSEVFDLADRAVVTAHGRLVGSVDVRASADVGTLAAQITVLAALSVRKLSNGKRTGHEQD